MSDVTLQQTQKIIEAAIAEAESQGTTEAKELKGQAEKKRQQLRNETTNKMGGTVAKVTDYLKG